MFAFKLIFKEIYHLFKNPYSRLFLWLAWRYGSKKRYQTTAIRFLNYHFTVPDCMSFIFQFKEIFVDESYKFKTQQTKPIIYDCGANIGMSCAYFKKKYPNATIKAFEADAKIAEILTHNLQKNQIKDVEIISQAVWTSNEGIAISLEGADGASVFGTGAKTLIPSVRLRDLLAKESSIAMLKMDIEGAETEVLLDCAAELSKIENIFIEYHAYLEQTQTLAQILEVLTATGFRYFIRNEADRPQPLFNQLPHNQTNMDLQLNIFAFRVA
jgi:FkbM family methyltransferase